MTLPAGEHVVVKIAEDPEQIVGLLTVIVGVGLTVIVTILVAPTQLPKVDVGVTEYVTNCTAPEVFTIVLLMVAELTLLVLSPLVLTLLAAIHEKVEFKLAVKL